MSDERGEDERADEQEHAEAHELNRVVDEVIRVTTWRNIRRFMTLGGLAWVIVDLTVTLIVVLVVAHETRQHDLSRDKDSCRDRITLAKIARTQVKEEAEGTEDLKKSGNTLGLTREKFDELVAKAEARNERYLAALDELATRDCQELE